MGGAGLALGPIETTSQILKAIGEKVFRLHRDKTGPLGFAHQALSKIHNKQGLVRYLVLLLLSLFLLWRTFGFLSLLIYPKIVAIFDLGEFEKANSLIYFDQFANILLILGAICFISLLAGCPEGKRRLLFIRKGHPLQAFCFYTSIFALLLVFGPGIISLGWPPDGLQSLWPHPKYLKIAVATAFCFGFSVADIAVKPGAIRWWSLPFLFVPTGPVFYLPLLWWNAFAGWVPSGYWKLWRPILLAGTALGPILVYPFAQPFLHDLPVFTDTGHEIIGRRIGYGIQKVPGANEVYISAVDNLQHFRKSQSRWLKANELNTGFGWDEASFDFAQNHAYIYDGNSGKLHKIRLNPLSPGETFEIPFESFPFRSGAIHQAYDDGRKILAIGEDDCFIVTLDTDPVRVRQSVKLGNRFGYIARILAIPERGELLVLGTNSLSAYRLEDMTLVRAVSLPDVSYGLVADESSNRIFVGLPQLMQVSQYSLSEFKLERTMPAPAGLRPLGLDSAENLLVLGSVSGAIETRRIEDWQKVRRLRIVPWIRRICVVPKAKEVILTSRSMPVVWSYSEKHDGIRFYDHLMTFAEKLGRRITGKIIQNRNEKSMRKPAELNSD